MKSDFKAYAAFGTALYLGDTIECLDALSAMACQRCGQLDCDGYPCTPEEIAEIEARAEAERWTPDALHGEVSRMLRDPGIVVFVSDPEGADEPDDEGAELADYFDALVRGEEIERW